MKREIEVKCQWLAVEEIDARVLRWLVAEGGHVEIDQDIAVLLLDNREFLLPAPVDGTIKTITAENGDPVDPDQVLAVIEID
jgi:pyruvate/2-oxoglutarate dehydrogenase complex dihydrolipoamide acyltransferase (E2) component